MIPAARFFQFFGAVVRCLEHRLLDLRNLLFAVQIPEFTFTIHVACHVPQGYSSHQISLLSCTVVIAQVAIGSIQPVSMTLFTQDLLRNPKSTKSRDIGSVAHALHSQISAQHHRVCFNDGLGYLEHPHDKIFLHRLVQSVKWQKLSHFK